MEEALARARERLEQAGRNLVDPARTKAAFERARAQMEALAQMGAELESLLPEQIGLAVREGLRAEALPVARQLAELRGLANQLIRRLAELEQAFEAERFARVEDLGLLVDLIAAAGRELTGAWLGSSRRSARAGRRSTGSRNARARRNYRARSVAQPTHRKAVSGITS